MSDAKTIHSQEISAGRRTYTIEVRVSQKNESYLVMKEFDHSSKERHQIMIFEDHLPAVKKAILEAIEVCSR